MNPTPTPDSPSPQIDPTTKSESISSKSVDPVDIARLRELLASKLADAEKSLSARNQMSESWREGTDASWREVGCFLGKSARIKEAESHERIAQRIQKDVDAFRQLIEMLAERDKLRDEVEGINEALRIANMQIDIFRSERDSLRQENAELRKKLESK